MTENDLTYAIRKGIFDVYNTLGPGLLESVYEKALSIEFESQGLQIKNQFPISIVYKEKDLGIAFRGDILVEERIIVEVKSVTELLPIHHKQLLNYLKLTGLHLGLLVNFNTTEINKNIFRIINGYL